MRGGVRVQYELVTLSPPQPSPVPVDPISDWVDYLGVVSGAIGALLAAVAIWYAFRQSAAAKRDLIRERRLEFELGILADLRRQMGVTKLSHISGYVAALVRDPADETDLPLLRSAIGVKPGPRGSELREAVVGGDREGSGEAQSRLLRAAQVEVDEAIQRRFESER